LNEIDNLLIGLSDEIKAKVRRAFAAGWSAGLSSNDDIDLKEKAWQEFLNEEAKHA
jgi:hypothetical protein